MIQMATASSGQQEVSNSIGVSQFQSQQQNQDSSQSPLGEEVIQVYQQQLQKHYTEDLRQINNGQSNQISEGKNEQLQDEQNGRMTLSGNGEDFMRSDGKGHIVERLTEDQLYQRQQENKISPMKIHIGLENTPNTKTLDTDGDEDVSEDSSQASDVEEEDQSPMSPPDRRYKGHQNERNGIYSNISSIEPVVQLKHIEEDESKTVSFQKEVEVQEDQPANTIRPETDVSVSALQQRSANASRMKNQGKVEEEERDEKEAEKGYDFGGAASKMINVQLVELFNPLKKFYQSHSQKKEANDKGKDTKDPPKQKEMVQLVQQQLAQLQQTPDLVSSQGAGVEQPAVVHGSAKPGTKGNRQANRFRHPKLLVNCFHTKYTIVRKIVRHDFKMRVVEEDIDDFDLLWCDHGLPPERIMRMKSYQRTNHFPGMQALTRKDNLGKNLNGMRTLFPEAFDFYPRTWLMPGDL